jgi:hypothetical protein
MDYFCREQKINEMIIFIKKIKTKEGINDLNIDKIKKDIPDGYHPVSNEPLLSITANHLVVAFKCEALAKNADKSKGADKPKVANKSKSEPKPKSKRIVVAKV